MGNLDSISHRFGDNQTWFLREREILEYLSGALKNFDVFIDLGANKGAFSMAANEFMHAAKIICVEANPKLIAHLDKTINAALKNKNTFELVQKAVSDERGTVEFFECDNSGVGNIFGNNDTIGTFSVPSCFLDDIAPKGKKIFVKMDIEGAEYRALKSAPRMLKSEEVTLFIELHAWGDREKQKYPLHVAGLMWKNGFKIIKIGRQWLFGSHYLFTKAPLLTRSLAFLKCFPALLCKYVVWRMLPVQAPRIEDFLRNFKRKLKKQPPESTDC